jgi:hypothetical protein
MDSILPIEINADTIFTFEDDEKSCAIHKIKYRSVVVYHRFKDMNYTIYTCEQPDEYHYFVESQINTLCFLCSLTGVR